MQIPAPLKWTVPRHGALSNEAGNQRAIALSEPVYLHTGAVVPEHPTSDRAADRALVDACVRGSRDAWEALVVRYAPRVRSTIAHTLRRYGAVADDALVEDLESHVFLGLIVDDARRLRQYSGRASLRTWLRVRAANATIDHLRRRRTTVPVHDCGDDTTWVDPVDPTASAEDATAHAQLLDALRAFMAELSDDDRRFAELFFGDELDYDTIAEITGATPGALYARKNRIRKKLVARAREAGWFDPIDRRHG